MKNHSPSHSIQHGWCVYCRRDWHHKRLWKNYATLCREKVGSSSATQDDVMWQLVALSHACKHTRPSQPKIKQLLPGQLSRIVQSCLWVLQTTVPLIFLNTHSPSLWCKSRAQAGKESGWVRVPSNPWANQASVAFQRLLRIKRWAREPAPLCQEAWSWCYSL